MRFEVGQKIGDYEFLEVSETAPTGVTYRVHNVLADREELLKVLPRDWQEDPELTERFLREAKIHARLRHPHVAAFYTATRVDGELVMTTELVEGSSLERRLRDGSLTIEQATKYFQQALSALSYAHREGVIHRDITPGHLIVTPEDAVKVTGFGLAKKTSDPQLTQPGLVMGSVHYMSPEQVKGSTDLDPRSDLYSLGVVLYEAVTGRKPFDSSSQFEIFLAHTNQEPAAPSSIRAELPAELDQIVLTAMAKQPSSRFQSAEEFSQSLEQLRSGVASSAAQAAPPPPQRLEADGWATEGTHGPIADAHGAETAPSSTQATPSIVPRTSAAPLDSSREAAPPAQASTKPAENLKEAEAEPAIGRMAGPSPGEYEPLFSSHPPRDAAQAGKPPQQADSDSLEKSAARDTGTPVLLRPSGDQGAPDTPRAAAAASRPSERVRPAANDFTGWSTQDVLAVGSLTFVIVATVIFVILTFLNR